MKTKRAQGAHVIYNIYLFAAFRASIAFFISRRFLVFFEREAFFGTLVLRGMR